MSSSHASAEVATVLGSIPASFDTMESEERQVNQCGIKYDTGTRHKKKKPKNSPCFL